MIDPILEMRRVSKSFFSIKALRGVDLTVYPGEIHALMGENGAGKSTLMKILSGAYRPDPGGEIRIEGKPVHFNGPHAGRAAGISIIYQELSLAPNLSVAQNIYLGREVSRFGVLAREAMETAVGPILERLGADFTPSTLVAGLSMGQRQLVEIARALHARSKILMMDEPTRGVDVGAKSEIYSIIDNLAKSGTAVLVISSDLPEIIGICDRVIVMRTGLIAGEIRRTAITPLDQGQIMALATGMEQVDA